MAKRATARPAASKAKPSAKTNTKPAAKAKAGAGAKAKSKPAAKAKPARARKAARQAPSAADGVAVAGAPEREPEGEDAPVADAVAPVVTSDVHSITTREPVRTQLAEDVERFLAEGGKIQEVPRNLRADPPRKPENNYGRGSI